MRTIFLSFAVIIFGMLSIFSLASQPVPPQPEKKTIDRSLPSVVRDGGIVMVSEDKLAESMWNIFYFIMGISIIAGIKKYADTLAGRWVTMYLLKKQGKISDGLRIRLDGYQGVIDDVSAQRIKISLDTGPLNPTGKNFIIVSPQEFLNKTIEVVISEQPRNASDDDRHDDADNHGDG